MSEEVIDMEEATLVDVSADEQVGEYPEIARKYKTGEALSDKELDTIADVALSVIRQILKHFDADDAPIDEYEGDDGELILDVTAPNLAVLIGRHGRTLEALQSLFSLIVGRRLGFRYPVVVDIEGYKSRRNEKVASMARAAAARAERQHSAVTLPPMSAYERRLVHIALRDYDSVETHSEGVEPERRVVVSPLA